MADPGLRARKTKLLETLRQHPDWPEYTRLVRKCKNPVFAEYRYYGAKGIRICSEWDGHFQKFIEDMGASPAGRPYLKRRDRSKSFHRGNCYWSKTPERYV